MAYDVELAGRIRQVLTGDPSVREMKMFGGLAFRHAWPADGRLATRELRGRGPELRSDMLGNIAAVALVLAVA